MTYEEFTEAVQTRAIAALQGIKSSLIEAGVPTNRINGPAEVDSEDLKFSLSASFGNGANRREFTAYIELTSTSRFTGTDFDKLNLTFLILDGNGVEITTDYSGGTTIRYTDEEGLQLLTDKLAQIEGAVPGAITKVRNVLRV